MQLLEWWLGGGGGGNLNIANNLQNHEKTVFLYSCNQPPTSPRYCNNKKDSPPTHLLPGVGHTGIKYVVESVAEVLTHDDGAINGQLEVHEGGAHNADHLLHAVNLLAQEDVQRLQRAHLLQALLHLWHTYIQQPHQHMERPNHRSIFHRQVFHRQEFERVPEHCVSFEANPVQYSMGSAKSHSLKCSLHKWAWCGAARKSAHLNCINLIHFRLTAGQLRGSLCIVIPGVVCELSQFAATH